MRERAHSGVDLREERSGLIFEWDEPPRASDLERQRAYAEWLAGFERRSAA